jgi:hypothetical protein
MRWNKNDIREFRFMRKAFKQCYKFHVLEYVKWRRTFNIVTCLSIILSFTAICMELIISDSLLVSYVTFSEKVLTMCLLVYLFTVNPGNKAYKHDKNATDYLTMSSDILIEARKDDHVDTSILTQNLYIKYKNAIDRAKHDDEINNPFDNNILITIEIDALP